jgi:hypothetical protein
LAFPQLDAYFSATRRTLICGTRDCGKPTEGIWSLLKRSIANFAVASFARLVQVIRHGLKKIQYRPGLIEGCLAGTGLTLEPDPTPNGHHELKICSGGLLRPEC